ncbi:MAG TPA: Rrf2 family transcriptional regulator [Dongiaceae bacterium]|jgi:Rrf2 family protein|nr:Rrf2 family transcriptional regulator [Dongiaceae bacterium]
MLSQKAKYAMRALLYLARAEPEVPVFISEIADQQSVPKKFLELILLDLKRHGLVHSQRGKKGGYLLARPPSQIFFGQVIRIIDGPLAQLPCASRTAYRRCDDCQDEKTCEIRKVLLQVRDSTARILDNTSLSDVMTGRTAELVAGAGI